jgi:peptidoglycan/xylan/chitin deacetylase (PgdA/CDA1 family)
MEVLASWDDASIADLKIAEIMLKYDVPTIFYWPSMLEKAKNMGTNSFLTKENCKEIAKKFTIGSHSASHQPMNKMTIPQLAMEISDSRKYWQDLTGQEINSFAYPKQSINPLIKSLVKGAGYKSARTNVVGHLKMEMINLKLNAQCKLV